MEKHISSAFVPSVSALFYEGGEYLFVTSVRKIPFIPSTFLVTATLFCIFLFILVLHFHCLTHWTRQARLLKQFNGGAILPLVGNCYELFGPSWKTHERITNYQKKHGTIARFWLSYFPLVISTSPEHAQKILSSTKDHLDKADIYKQLHDFLGEGLVTSSTVIWKKDRKIFNRGFNRQSLKTFLSTFNQEGRILTDKLRDDSTKQGLESGTSKPRNYYPFFLAAGLEIILVATLGKGLNLQEEGEHNQFAKSMKLIAEGTHDRLFKPYIHNTPFFNRILGRITKEMQAKQIVTEACQTARNRKIQEMQEQGFTVEDQNDNFSEMNKAKPVLDYLMEQSPQPSIATYRDHLQTFIGAGSDTTSTSVYQTLFFLALNPEYQRKCHEEVDRVLCREQDPLEITEEQIAQAEYVERCWKESIRLRPPIPLFGRNLSTDLVLDDGRVLPKGTGVMFNVWDMHRDPEIFPDPLKFDPDRFLPENVATRKVHSYIPFSYGVRNCIGYKYAQMKAKVFLIHILARFGVQTEQKMEDIKIIFGAPSQPIPGMEMSFIPR